MIFKSLKDFVFQLIAGANFATILAMAFTGYVDRLNPYSFPEKTSARRSKKESTWIRASCVKAQARF